MDTTGSAYMQDRFVESLSHGMKQRVAIARTMLHDPEVLILDEPANGLDPVARVEMRDLLLRLAELGKTLIVTSHILPELSRICDQVAIITHGKLRAYGSLEEVMRKVTQRRTVEIQLVDVAQMDATVAAIQPRVDVDAEVTTSPAESVVRFTTNLPEQELSAILAGLIEAGIVVSQFRELQQDLEDTFLSITREAQEERQREADMAAAAAESDR